MESEPPEEYKQVSLETIKDTIKNPPSRDETVHRFICDEVGYWRLRTLLEEYRVAGIYFDASLHHLRFVTMPSYIHDAPVSWFNSWCDSLGQHPLLLNSHDLRGEIKGLNCNCNKEPDAAFSPDDSGDRPTIVVEIGYSEPLSELKFDARTLLEGSDGEIKLALLIDIQPLQRGDTSIQKAVIQVWKYDFKDKKAAYVTQKNIIPPPDNHSKQVIDIPWSSILRTGPYPTDPLPPLNLDRLRSKLECGLKTHLKNLEKANEKEMRNGLPAS